MIHKKAEVTTKPGDISEILNTRPVSDLSWLDVNEEEYHAFEALPKQNFSMQPELQDYFSEDAKSDLIPNKIHTIVNTKPNEHPNAPLAAQGEKVKRKTARLVMEGRPVADILTRLASEFASADIQAVGSEVRALIAQRGLLGPVYIVASHFPQYGQTGSEDQAFVTRFAKNAMFVVASDPLQSALFGRHVVASPADIPYDEVVDHYRSILEQDSVKFVQASDAKSSLRLSFTHRQSAAPNEVQTIQKPLRLHKNVEHRVASPTFQLSTDYVKFARRMMEGRDDRPLLQASESPELTRLASEFGVLGHDYLDVDALGGCSAALAWLRRASKTKTHAPRFLVRREAACSNCGTAKNSTCGTLSRISTFIEAPPSFTRQDFVLACVRSREAGKLSDEDFRNIVKSRKATDDWKSLTASVNLHVPAPRVAEPKTHRLRAHQSTIDPINEVDGEELRVYIARLQNTGVHGEALREKILLRFPEEGVRRHASVLREAARVDEVQGSHYIDPSCYSDYGRGCSQGSKVFRANGPKHILACSSCTGCGLQTAPGWCSKYAKTMIRPLPDQELAVLRTASRKVLPVLKVAVRDPGQEWELEGPSGDLDLGSARQTPDFGFSGR